MKGLGGGRGHLPNQPSASRGMGSIAFDAFHAPLKQRIAAVVPLQPVFEDQGPGGESHVSLFFLTADWRQRKYLLEVKFVGNYRADHV